MHIHRRGVILALAALGLTGTAAAAARCRIEQFPALPVTMQNGKAVVTAQINGVPAHFAVDTGSFYSMIWAAAAAQYGLRIFDTPPESTSVTVGFGGTTFVQSTTVKTFRLLGVPIRNLQFMVAEKSADFTLAGLLGENVLQVADDEFDLPDGVMRFDEAIDCGSHPLAYWAGGEPVSTVDLVDPNSVGFATGQYGAYTILLSHVQVDGHAVLAMFDTGSPRSMLSLQAAQQIGITPHSAGVAPVGVAGGIGGALHELWVAPIAVVQIGSEKIEHTHILIGDLHSDFGQIGLVLGADFFLAHRVYVARGQDKLYFTYSGGPVFDLAPGQTATRSANTAPQATPFSPAPAAPRPDAATLFRRAMAHAARGQYDLALADLDRACELDPTNAQYRYRRGLLYRTQRRPDSALKDFDAAVRLQPDDFRARFARAELRLNEASDSGSGVSTTARAAILADLNAVNRLAPPEADLRVSLGVLYTRLKQYAAAIHQYDVWIRYHGTEVGLAGTRNDRCWARAEANRALGQALRDCDWAVDHMAFTGRAAALDTRGLVYLRLDRFRRAVRDYDTAITAYHAALSRFGAKFKRPGVLAGSLYGRGLAELRLGEWAQGRADLAAAGKLDRGTAGHFAQIGLRP